MDAEARTYRFNTRKLGLAAYIKMKGGMILSKSRSHGYTFESPRPLNEWATEYANSCCNTHDVTLIGLRNMPDEGESD